MAKFNVAAAKQAGYSDQEIQQFMQSQGLQENTPKTGGFKQALKDIATTTVLRPAEVLAQTGRALTSPLIMKSALGMQLTPEETQKLGSKQIGLVMPDEQVGNELGTRGDILRTGAKATAGAASLAVPGGVGGKGVAALLKTLGLGAVSGGAYGFGASEKGDEISSTLGGAAGGAIAGGAIKGLGALGGVLGKGVGKSGQALSERASASLLKTSPSVYNKAVEKGVNVNSLLSKHLKGITNYDKMLGSIASRNKGGIVGNLMKAAEGKIQAVADTAGNNIRLTTAGAEITKALKSEARTIAKELGGNVRLKSLNKIIDQVSNKYKNGVTVKQALMTLRAANKKFGESILDTEGGAVVSAAQKVEGNVLRKMLKKTFPEIADALDNQSELLTLRPILAKARSSAKTVDVRRPLGLTDAILASGGFGVGGPAGAVGALAARKVASSPAVLSKTGAALSRAGQGVGGALPEALGNILRQAAPIAGAQMATGGVSGGVSSPVTESLPQNQNNNEGQQLQNQIGQIVPPEKQATQDPQMKELQSLFLTLALQDPENIETYSMLAKALTGKDALGQAAGEQAFDPSELPTIAAREYTDIATARSLLGSLKEEQESLLSGSAFPVTGPIAGRIRGKNPYDLKAVEFSAFQRVVKQIIGKGLEGGVLRKEDEAKYEFILPNIKDTSQAIDAKIKRLEQVLDAKEQSIKDVYGGGAVKDDMGSLMDLLQLGGQ